MKNRDILSLICFTLMSCSSPHRGLRSGDLIFLRAGDSNFEKAISGSTRGLDADFTHVGILDITGGDTTVIEATPGRGVTVTPLSELLADGQDAVFVEVDDSAASRATEIARRYIGQPYDWEFLPGNGAVYCSELVQISYLRPDSTPLFAPVPINFVDSSGRIPQFWLSLYADRGMQVPQAAPGSSPNSIFSQCHRYKKTEKKH